MLHELIKRWLDSDKEFEKVTIIHTDDIGVITYGDGNCVIVIESDKVSHYKYEEADDSDVFLDYIESIKASDPEFFDKLARWLRTPNDILM